MKKSKSGRSDRQEALKGIREQLPPGSSSGGNALSGHTVSSKSTQGVRSKGHHRNEQRLRSPSCIECDEYKELVPTLQLLVPGIVCDAGIALNNFIRNATFGDYIKYDSDQGPDSTEEPSFFSGNLYNQILQIQALQEISGAKNKQIPYLPMTPDRMRQIICLSEAFDVHRLENDSVFYRGCNSLEIDGMNALVSATTSKDVARQHCRGTLITFKCKRGTPFLVPNDIFDNFPELKHENEVLLLPGKETKNITKRRVKKLPAEKNNRSDFTTLLEIEYEPTSLLELLHEKMINIPQGYIDVYFPDNLIDFIEATWILEDALDLPHTAIGDFPQ